MMYSIILLAAVLSAAAAAPCDPNPCAPGQTCVNSPKQCITQPCPQYECQLTPFSFQCYDCKTPGVKSYYDGCNQCSCSADGTAVCSKRACNPLLNQDASQCTARCDGYVTPDGGPCGSCTCMGGQKTKCSRCAVGTGCRTAQDGTSSCVAVVPPTNVDCSSNPCGANEICIEEPKQCITTPCPQFKCVSNSTVQKCFDCKTAGVKSFFDGCSQCTCGADGTAVCTKIACAPVLYGDAKSCSGRCDGYTTTDDGTCGTCTCVNGQKTSCSNCAVGTGCRTAQDGTSACAAVVPPQTTCTENAQVPKGDACNTCKCIDGKPQQCTSRRCSKYCAGVTKCAESGKICVAQRKQCITTPCDQYACVAIDSAEARNDAMLVDMDDVDTAGAAQQQVAVASLVGVTVTIVVAML